MKDEINLQKMLDAGGEVLIPAGRYEIEKPLEIGEGTRLFLGQGTVIRLADGANCPMLINRIAEGKKYTSDFTVEGGIWDGNNVGQGSKELVMMFTGVKNFRIRNLTVKDPGGFCIMLTDSERYTVEDIIFDCNNATLNEDGLHVNGYSKDGYIHNLKGHTNDDMVALNADEGEFTGPENDIENITIDGIYGGGNGWTGIRLLSRVAHVKHITIRNLYGAYKFNAVSFTHWHHHPDNFGFFDDIVLENIHASCCLPSGNGHGGLIWFQPDVVNVGTIVIDKIFRTEGDGLRNSTSLIEIGDRVKIGTLCLSRIFEKIPDDKPTFRKGKDVVIGNLVSDGTVKVQ